MKTFILESDYIELSQLLKLLGPFQSGGEVKHAIANGHVYVDGVVELRRKCKLRVGQRITYQTTKIELIGEPQ